MINLQLHSRKRNRDDGLRKYTRIEDRFHKIDQVTEALQKAGLESSNLIIGIDFTKSNEWTGRISFNGKNLHHISDTPNPYEQAISIIGRTLSKFDEDNLIPCFGFGDARTHDTKVFSFYPDERDRPCIGFEEVLLKYRDLIPRVKLSGPTSFAPIIEKSIEIIQRSGHLYHILLIIADGQVSGGKSMHDEYLSYQDYRTIQAIVKASYYPLSIVLVGVGDGPWDVMKKYDDYLNEYERLFDNFQFVNFTDIMSRDIPLARKEAEFAREALMEIPLQFNAINEYNLCSGDYDLNIGTSTSG